MSDWIYYYYYYVRIYSSNVRFAISFAIYLKIYEIILYNYFFRLFVEIEGMWTAQTEPTIRSPQPKSTKQPYGTLFIIRMYRYISSLSFSTENIRKQESEKKRREIKNHMPQWITTSSCLTPAVFVCTTSTAAFNHNNNKK